MLEPKEAFAGFRDVNDKRELFGPVFKNMIERYNALAEENCSGLRLGDGNRVLLESRGEGYGVRLSLKDKDGQGLSGAPLVGFLLLDKPASLGPAALKQGVHLLLVTSGKLYLSQGYDEAALELAKPLDPETEKDNGPRPKLSLALEARQAFLLIGENRFAFRSPAPPPKGVGAKPAAAGAAGKK
jgi:hypothetical protein